MKKIALGYVLGVVSLAIGYVLWIGEDVKIPSKIGCKIVNCYQGQYSERD